jgi:hypothetical protein
VVFFFEGDLGNFADENAMMVQLIKQYGQSVYFERIDSATWSEAADKFDVTDFPTMLVIEGKSKKGYIVYPQRLAGAEDREALVAAIDEVLASKT